jgi:hypothetical protein
MATIEVDFEVFKELTVRRESEAMTYNDVIRGLLGIAKERPKPRTNGAHQGWAQKNVVFPNGTEFRANYKGRTYTATVSNNQLVLEGKAMGSLSGAAASITKTFVNGWRFWRYRFPGETDWRLAETLRS